MPEEKYVLPFLYSSSTSSDEGGPKYLQINYTG